MPKRFVAFLALLAVLVLAGCAPKPVDFDLEVKVRLDGRPVKGASVLVDGVAAGATDPQGGFTKTYARLPGQAVRVEVRADDAKLGAKDWQQEFTVKMRKDDEAKEKQSFAVDLQRFVTIAVMHDGKPVAGAAVSIDGKSAGDTPESGEIEHVFAAFPKAGLNLAVKKDGIGEARLTYKGKPGDRVEVKLYKEAVVTVEVLEDRNGTYKPLKGAVVSLGDKELGATGNDGKFTYRRKGASGETATLRIAAAGHLPSSYARSVKLAGQSRLRQHFQPATAQQPRTAVMHFAGNTAGEDIGDVAKRIEAAFVQELFKAKPFKQVPTETALNLIKRSKVPVEKMKTAGWRNTELAEAVDVLVFGSVSRGEGDAYVVEVSFYQAEGKLALTQAAVAGSSGSWRVGRAAGELVSNVLDLYPFAGVVLGSGDDGHRINLGRAQFPIDGDDVFMLQPVRRDEEGRTVGLGDGGTLKTHRNRDDHSILQDQALRAAPRPGDRVVRIDATMRTEGAEHATVSVKAGEGGPLAGANVYVDRRWVGATDRKGETTVPLLPGRSYKLLVYRHGYEQANKSIEAAGKGERHEFALKSFNSLFTVESEPAGAAVSLDGNRIGTTPIAIGHPVTRGFHTVKIDAGGDYRAFEEVIEFSQKEEARTGSNRVVLQRDVLRLAERAEASRNFTEAIRLYGTAPKEHPDYAEIRHRLGQLYYDDLRDYDRAIAEFELVQKIPEVQELVFKQFAVLYTNLGRAYYAKGEQVFRANRGDAVQFYAKAIKALDRARENTRFFPAERHDEAVHDTYYYRAMAYHNLYNATKREAVAREVEIAWQEYFDFFPPKLRGKSQFDQLREAGERLAEQVQGR